MGLVLSFLLVRTTIGAEVKSAASADASQSSSLAKKALYVTVGTGALVSGIMWSQATCLAIARFGISGAIYTTHIPRLLLDMATVAVCYNAYSAESNRK